MRNGKAQWTHGADEPPEGVECLQLRTRLEVRRGLRLDDLEAGKRFKVGSYHVSIGGQQFGLAMPCTPPLKSEVDDES